jgi:hypothetical protein
MRTLWILLASAAAAFGQLDTKTITITASSTPSAKTSNATVQVNVMLSQASTLQDAVNVVQGAGFTADNFTDVSSYGYANFLLGIEATAAPTVDWTLSRTLSATEVPSVLAALEAATKKQPSGTLSYSVSNAAAPPPDCPYTGLVGAAQSQARKVADAAGVKLGGIVSIEQGTQTQAAAGFAVFDFSAVLSSTVLPPERVALIQTQLTSPISSCSVTVQFQIAQ